MDYGFKLTTNGRKAVMACMENASQLTITRVPFGNGLIPEDVEMADQHSLIHYIGEGSIADRRHENDRLYLTVQYNNKANPQVPTTFIREFMVFCLNPDTGEETDLLYATLGEYAQPIPKWQQDMPASIFNYPITLVFSGDCEVHITAPAGLVTYAELSELVRQTDITIPRTGWTADDGSGYFPFCCDVAVDNVSERMIPAVTVLPESVQTANQIEFGDFARTMRNAVRVYASRVPDADMKASLLLLANPPYVRSDGTSDVITTDDVRSLSEEELKDLLGS